MYFYAKYNVLRPSSANLSTILDVYVYTSEFLESFVSLSVITVSAPLHINTIFPLGSLKMQLIRFLVLENSQTFNNWNLSSS